MSKGQFKIQKLSNVGTSNPIVFGLTIGLHDIVNIAQIDKDTRDAINTANLNIAHSLTKAEKIGLQICRNMEAVMDELKKNGVQTQSDERCVNLPSTDNLDDIRDFLKYGKQALQELVRIINLFCPTGCTNPNYKKIYAKLGAFYGENDHIYLLIKKGHDEWLKKFLDLRDADEHPEGYIPKGKNLYNDFDINWSETHKKWMVMVPHFYEGTSVEALIKASINNIFTFTEEVNILLLQKKMPKGVEIIKVSENQRSEYGGRNFTLALKPPLYPKGAEPKT